MKEKFQNGEGVSHSQNNTACKQANPKNKIYYRHHISNYCQEKCFRKCVVLKRTVCCCVNKKKVIGSPGSSFHLRDQPSLALRKKL